MITAILVEDHEIYRLGIKSAFENNEPDIEIVAEAETGAEFFALLKAKKADIVLLDIGLPDMSGVEIARRLKKEKPEMKILVTSTENTEETIKELVDIGIDGFISKREGGTKMMIEAIRSIMNGLEYFGKDIAQIIYKVYVAKKKTTEVTAEFTEIERKVIELCRTGLPSKQIADRLNLSPRTIENHKSRIFHKLGINNTVEMVQYAMKKGIIFLLFCFSAFLLLQSCNSKQKDEIKRQKANEAIQKPVFNSEVDSMEWVLENYQLTTDEKAEIYFRIQYEFDDFDKERYYTLKVLSLAESEKDELLMARAYRSLGCIYERFGYRDSAWFYLNKSLNEAKRLKNKDLEALTIFSMGNISTGEQAISYYKDALKYWESDEVFKSENVNYNIRTVLRNIAVMYNGIGNWEQAEKYILRVGQMTEEAGEITELAITYHFYVDIYLRKGNPELALDYAMRSLNLISDESNYNPRVLPYSLQYVAYAYKKGFKDYKKALKYGYESLEAAEKYSGTREIAMACNTIANVYYGLENYAQADAMATKGYETDSLVDVVENMLQTIVSSNIMLGNKDKAMQFLEKLEDYYSNIVNEEYQSRLSETEVRYETEKKQLEIEKQQQVIKRQTMQRNFLAGGIALSIVILALLYSLLRSRTRQKQTLAEMNTTKDKFFTIISHDLKNPAIAQREALQMLLENAKQWNPEQLEKYCHGLMKSADGLVDLLYNLLNWAQLQTGRMQYCPVQFNLATELRKDSFLHFHNLAKNKEIALEFIIPEEHFVTADVNMIHTIIRNLLDNAIKFTPRGGQIILEISQGTGVSPYAPTRISISDTGIGMTEEQIRHIIRKNDVRAGFKPAPTGTGVSPYASTRGTAGESGTGLGLTVCKELLEKHGTTLHIESEIGKGTIFWFEI